uniref:acyltransferase family protein n=1 Tax=Candidatus Electronema sp. TaxID=2698783 RepID=UPI004057504A
MSASDKIDKLSSDRLAALRFPLIVGVVFIHAAGSGVGLSTGTVGVERISSFSLFIQNFISQSAARTAVPLFFLMSGYFFFLDFSWTSSCFKEKIKSRTRTLVVPFLFWNLAMLVSIALIQQLPEALVYFPDKKYIISSFTAYDYIDAVVGIDRFSLVYQFWFIRDLIVLVVSSWLFYPFLRNIPTAFICCSFIFWFFSIWPLTVPSGMAFFFFYAGACAASFNISLFTFDRIGVYLLPLWISILLADTLTKGHSLNVYVHYMGNIIGLPAVLYATSLALSSERVKNTLIRASKCSFFLFAVHEPLLTAVKKITYRAVSPSSDAAVLLLYFAIPLFVIFLAVFLHTCMDFLFPRTLKIISGGR